MVPTPNSIALFEALPNAKLSIFPDASHGGIFQYADAFVDQALRFLQNSNALRCAYRIAAKGTPP